MPYIPQERRQELYPLISKVAGEIQAAVESGIGKRGGEVNFVICSLVDMLYDRNYTELSAAISDVECAKLEIHRRLLAPYEDVKILENGDVFA